MQRSLILSLAIGLAAGCTPTTDSANPGPHAFASAGNRQAGAPRQELPIPLEVTVLDADGLPVAGATVYWDGAHNGTVEPLGHTTDADGHARARFILGDTEGIASLYAAVVNVDSVPFQLEVRLDGPPSAAATRAAVRRLSPPGIRYVRRVG